MNRFGNQIEPWDGQYGWHKKPIIKLMWNEARAANEPQIVAYESAFEFKWDKNEVKKLLLDSSAVPCKDFYVGVAGTNEPVSSRDRLYQIRNLEDFLEGSWEDLYDLSRLGLSYPEKSLHLIEAGRRQERENRERQVGINSPKVYIQ